MTLLRGGLFLPERREYDVIYRRQPCWLIGEHQDEAYARREGPSCIAPDSRRYPDDYAGQVTAVLPATDEPHPSGSLFVAARMNLTPEEFVGLKSRRLKVTPEGLSPVTFEDRWGAVAKPLRDGGHVTRTDADPPDEEKDPAGFADWEAAQQEADRLRRALPKTKSFSGTGFYCVDPSPTMTEGAITDLPGGQDVILSVGGFSEATHKGGYVWNITRNEERSIVEVVQGNRITVEGNIATWQVGDTVRVYNAWATIQLALDQLWTDQGSAAFTASQYIRIFAGTYDETATPNASLDPDELNGHWLVIEGDPNDSRANIRIKPTSGSPSYGLYINCDSLLLRHLTVAGNTNYALSSGSGSHTIVVMDCVVAPATGWGLQSYRNLEVVDTKVTITANAPAIRSRYGVQLHVEHCKVVGPGSGTSTLYGVYGYRGIRITATVISGFRYSIWWTGDMYCRHIDLANITLHDCTNGVYLDTPVASSIRFFVTNVIFASIGYPYRLTRTDLWPEETFTRWGPYFVLRNNCYHNYTAFAYDGTTMKTRAQFVACNQVDAAGELDATDPRLTDPASGDFSLQPDSPCRRGGVGAGVTRDVGGDSFCLFHPDIGGVSTGAGPWDKIGAAGLK